MQLEPKFINKQYHRLYKIWNEMVKIRFDLDHLDGQKITRLHRQDYHDIFTSDFQSYDFSAYKKLNHGMVLSLIENLQYLAERINKLEGK